MKRNLKFLILFITAMLVACGTKPSPDVNELFISSPDQKGSFTLSDLQELPKTRARFNNVDYEGVALLTLLENGGYNPDEIQSVQAVASDGYSVEYPQDIVLLDDTIVAYRRADGDLANDDGTFRMVLPNQEGKLNLRYLVELRINQ